MKLRPIIALAGIAVLAVTGCKTIKAVRKALPPADTKFVHRPYHLLTPVDPGSSEQTESKVFEPDFVFRQNGQSAYGFYIEVRNRGNFAFTGSVMDPSGREVAIESWSKTSPGVGTGEGDRSFRDNFVIEQQNRDLMNKVIGQRQPIYWMVNSSLAKQHDTASDIGYTLAVVVPENLIGDHRNRQHSVIRFRNGGMNPENKPFAAAEIKVTRNAVFNIAVFGDSYMWGQGLKEEDKHYSMIAKEIHRSTGLAVRVYRFAHSGARIGEITDAHARNPASFACTSQVTQSGEIPGTNHKHALIPCQIRDYWSEPGHHAANLVLIDGCGNDVGIDRMLMSHVQHALAEPAIDLLPVPDIPVVKQVAEWLKDKAKNHVEEQIVGDFATTVRATCQARMTRMLTFLSGDPRTRSAKVIVTGYPQPVTSGSKDASLVRLVVGPDKEIDLTPDTVKTLLSRALPVSEAWYNQSNAALSNAVRAVDPSQSRIQFARLTQTPGDSGMYAPNSIFWDYRSEAHKDSVRDERRKICDAMGIRGNDLCYVLGIAHPNTEGSKIYFQAIKAILENGPFNVYAGFNVRWRTPASAGLCPTAVTGLCSAAESNEVCAARNSTDNQCTAFQDIGKCTRMGLKWPACNQ